MTNNNNNNKTLNVPPLRFPGFSNDWKLTKLSQLVERVTRKNKNEESKIALTISAQYGLVDQESFFNNKVASADLSHYYLLYNGEYAYNKSYSANYPWGATKRLNLYDKGAVSTLYICFRPKDSVDSDFIGHYFESSKWHKGVSEIAVEGARNHGLLNIGVKDYFETTHFIPSLPEQKKIAALLNLIDERIATQNKIIEELKKLKSAISNKIFASTDLLECKRNISDIGTLKNGYAFQSATYNPKGIYSILTIANITGERYIDTSRCNQITNKPADLQHHQSLVEHDILISLTGNVGRVSLCTQGNYLLNQRVGLLQLYDGESREFIYQVLSSGRFEKSMISCAQGAAQMNIGKGDIENFVIPYSSNTDNIEYIAQTLHTYDECILVEMCYLTLLYQQRQYLLSQMFI